MYAYKTLMPTTPRQHVIHKKDQASTECTKVHVHVLVLAQACLTPLRKINSTLFQQQLCHAFFSSLYHGYEWHIFLLCFHKRFTWLMSGSNPVLRGCGNHLLSAQSPFVGGCLPSFWQHWGENDMHKIHH